MSEEIYLIWENIRSGKTIRIQQEYEKAKADGKKVLLVDKKQLEKKLLGAKTPFDKFYNQEWCEE